MSGLPHLAELDKGWRDRPFKLIGIHCQEATREEIASLVKEKGVEFTVTEGGSYAKEQFSGIPFCVVFDHTGKQVFAGKPAGAEKAAEAALLAAPSLWLGPEPYKTLKSLAAKASAKQKLGSVLEAAEKKSSAEDPEERAEARRLVETLVQYRDRRRETLAADKEKDPVAYVEGLESLRKEFAGHKESTKPLDEEISAAKRSAAYKELKKRR